ncbi:MAG: hypothetical protein Q9227_000733 [Pyrenula ochraceoflavens]
MKPVFAAILFAPLVAAYPPPEALNATPSAPLQVLYEGVRVTPLGDSNENAEARNPEKRSDDKGDVNDDRLAAKPALENDDSEEGAQSQGIEARHWLRSLFFGDSDTVDPNIQQRSFEESKNEVDDQSTARPAVEHAYKRDPAEVEVTSGAPDGSEPQNEDAPSDKAQGPVLVAVGPSENLDANDQVVENSGNAETVPMEHSDNDVAGSSDTYEIIGISADADNGLENSTAGNAQNGTDQSATAQNANESDFSLEGETTVEITGEDGNAGMGYVIDQSNTPMVSSNLTSPTAVSNSTSPVNGNSAPSSANSNSVHSDNDSDSATSTTYSNQPVPNTRRQQPPDPSKPWKKALYYCIGQHWKRCTWRTFEGDNAHSNTAPEFKNPGPIGSIGPDDGLTVSEISCSNVAFMLIISTLLVRNQTPWM